MGGHLVLSLLLWAFCVLDGRTGKHFAFALFQRQVFVLWILPFLLLLTSLLTWGHSNPTAAPAIRTLSHQLGVLLRLASLTETRYFRLALWTCEHWLLRLELIDWIGKLLYWDLVLLVLVAFHRVLLRRLTFLLALFSLLLSGLTRSELKLFWLDLFGRNFLLFLCLINSFLLRFFLLGWNIDSF